MKQTYKNFKYMIAFVPIVLFCASAISQNLSIEGTIEGNTADTIFLTTFAKQGEMQASAPINDKGEFSFEVTIPESNFFKLSTSPKNFLILVLSPNEKVTITATGNDLFNSSKIEGSSQTDLFYEANDVLIANMKKKEELQAKLKADMDAIDTEEEKYIIDFLEKNKNSMACLMVIDKLKIDKHLDKYKQLDEDLMKAYPNNSLVKDFHEQLKRLSFLSVGSEVPDIVLKDIHGKEVKLSSLKGKYVLIDFWASWCMPCRQELPNIRRLYEMYNKKGFEVFSVSIDKDKSKWESASKDFPWANTFDDGGKYAQMFQVASIPFTLLIDKEGKIMDKNVRGSQLHTIVAGLFEE